MGNKTHRSDTLIIGIDVGSTTAKATVVDPSTNEILWSDYQRHHTKQAENVLEFLLTIGNEFQDVKQENIRVFMTGSGIGPVAPHIGAKFVQEVNTVTMAVEHLHPDVRSVIELGGQDAKKDKAKKGDSYDCKRKNGNYYSVKSVFTCYRLQG
ncbi:hypothetical protein GCM10010912_41650 [Paenibacillus albidus]|uniref:ATPase BadF/BadG/BcrA/BcrD type domain-containing protein n=1 Tax=Paenibacillus albidus TaxID=2041023 RepID=A0A917FP84_9BACL|nr:hypothetical protein GCM10010912_41650 [Paenibacillus albidus]